MNKRPKIALRYVGGKFEPAGSFAKQQVADKRFREGQIVGATLTKSRTLWVNNLAHKLGKLCAQNIDDLHGMDAHDVLKRLQVEARVECKSIWRKMTNAESLIARFVSHDILEKIGMNPTTCLVEQLIPESLSFENMDEDRFKSAVRGICRHIAAKYWPSCTPEEIEIMAGCMVEE